MKDGGLKCNAIKDGSCSAMKDGGCSAMKDDGVKCSAAEQCAMAT